jgi:hypothetical protein
VTVVTVVTVYLLKKNSEEKIEREREKGKGRCFFRNIGL